MQNKRLPAESGKEDFTDYKHTLSFRHSPGWPHRVCPCPTMKGGRAADGKGRWDRPGKRGNRELV